MKRFAALLGSTVLLTAPAAMAAELNVVTSIKPVHSLVSAVMEGVAEPSLIVKGAGSPHTYTMRPSDAQALENASVIFWIGEGLEAFLDGPIETVGSRAKVIELGDLDGLTKLELREGGAFEAHDHDHEAGEEDHNHDEAGHDHDDDNHGHDEAGHDDDDDKDHAGHHHDDETDMHLWLDPLNAKVFVTEIAEALSEADPENAARYAANAEAVETGLDALIEEIDAELTPVRGKPFIVFHDGYHYFENRFDVEAAGSITVNPDTAPGAQRIAEIQQKIAELGATCVFTEPQFEPRVISVVTEGTGAKAGELDPLGAALEDGPDLYPSLIRNIAGSLRDCLAGDS